MRRQINRVWQHFMGHKIFYVSILDDSLFEVFFLKKNIYIERRNK